MMENSSAELSIEQRKEIFNENFADIKKRIAISAEKSGRTANDIMLLAATKTIDIEVINHAIASGLSAIGENRVQEFLSKEEKLLPVDKHFIGHLQSNKAKDIVGKVSLIHSVHSLKLAKIIGEISVKAGDVITSGQVIAKSATSNISTELGNHLYFELIIDGICVDPENYYDNSINEI